MDGCWCRFYSKLPIFTIFGTTGTARVFSTILTLPISNFLVYLDENLHMGFVFFFIFLGLTFWIGTAFLIASYARKKQVGFGITFLVCLIFSPIVGFIIALLSPPHNNRSTRFEHTYEEARKEEFKGNIVAAVDKYLDALFYLHTDFKNVPPEQLKAHKELSEIIERKIASLKPAAT